MLWISFLPLLLSYAAALQCPQISCAALGANVCARRNDPFKLDLAVDPCSSDRECHALSVFSWLNSGDSSNLYYCRKKPLVSTVSSYTGTRYCIKREANKDFKGGVTLVTCSKDSDCILDDNTFDVNACMCGVRGNGKGLCNPNVSSSAFAGLWTACGTDNTIKSEAEYEYWMFYIQMWVYTQSDLECSKNLYELQQLITLHDLYANWSPLLLVSSLLIV